MKRHLSQSVIGGWIAVLSIAPDIAPQNNTPLAAKLEGMLHRRPYFADGFTGSVLVARDGQVILHRSYGLARMKPRKEMSLDAIWDWCSVTKQFTAAAILRLQEMGRLKLSDPITRHFKRAPKDKSAVTIRHLLDHTSGLENDRGYGRVGLFDKKAATRYLLSRPLKTEPGKEWKYNNSAYFLLASLIEQVSKKRFESFLREQVFTRAGMTGAGSIGDTHVDYDLVPFEDRGSSDRQFAYGKRLSWGYRGAGGVLASTEDMFRWHRALRGDRVLSAKSREIMFRPGLKNYGLGWFISKSPGGDRFAYHSGNTGKVVTFFLRYLDKDIVVALAFSHPPGRRVQMAAMSLAGVTAAASAKDLVGGVEIRPPVSSASEEAAATPRRPAALIDDVKEPARFFEVLDELTELCKKGKSEHVRVLRHLSSKQHRRGVSAEMKLRYTMLGRALNDRVLAARRHEEVVDRLRALRKEHTQMLETLPKGPALRRALDRMKLVIDRLGVAVKAKLPAGMRPEYVPRGGK